MRAVVNGNTEISKATLTIKINSYVNYYLVSLQNKAGDIALLQILHSLFGIIEVQTFSG